jgi:hypothetical protein
MARATTSESSRRHSAYGNVGAERRVRECVVDAPVRESNVTTGLLQHRHSAGAPTHCFEGARDRRQLAPQALEQILFDGQAAHVEHARLCARRNKLLLVRLRNHSRHDRCVRCVVAQKPEAKGVTHGAAVLPRELPEPGKDDEVPARVEVMNVSDALVLSAAIEVTPGYLDLRHELGHGLARDPLEQLQILLAGRS